MPDRSWGGPGGSDAGARLGQAEDDIEGNKQSLRGQLWMVSRSLSVTSW